MLNKTITKVTNATSLQECTTARQAANGTIAFHDAELGEFYTIHPRTGYARRKNVWGSVYQLNDKREEEHTYTVDGVSRTFTFTAARILTHDLNELADLVIRGYNDRRSPARAYVRDAARRV